MEYILGASHFMQNKAKLTFCYIRSAVIQLDDTHAPTRTTYVSSALGPEEFIGSLGSGVSDFIEPPCGLWNQLRSSGRVTSALTA